MFEWLVIAGIGLMAFALQVRAKDWLAAFLLAVLAILALAQAYAHIGAP